MLDRLHLDRKIACAAVQRDVVVLVRADRHPERGAPKARRLRQISVLTIDDKPCESAAMHPVLIPEPTAFIRGAFCGASALQRQASSWPGAAKRLLHGVT